MADGSDLAAMIAGNGPLPAARAVEIVAQVAAALAVAHGRGEVHRALKLSSVLVTPSAEPGGIDVVDLADSAVVESRSASSLSDAAALDYMAPELFEGRPADHRVDTYALGCLLYETLTARKPFPGEGLPATMRGHLDLAPPKPSQHGPGVAPELDAVVARAMAKSPEERYQSATELADAARAAIAPGRATVSSWAGWASAPVLPPVSPPDAAASDAEGEVYHMPLVVGETYPVSTLVASEVVGPTVAPVATPASTDVPVHRVEGAADDLSAIHPIATGSLPFAQLSQSPSWRRWLPVAALLVLAIAGTSVWWAIGRAEVEVLAPAERGHDPFGPSFVTQLAPPPELVSVQYPGATNNLSGDVEGLYQATFGVAACDRSKLASFLASGEIGRVWAAPLTRRSPGIDPPTYVAQLTPVLLRSDTRVTAHRLVGGAAEPFQALLRAGTAVLVDDLGVPRVRCADTSPLTGMSTGRLMRAPGPNEVAITQSFKTIPEFALADAAGGAQFRRPTGTAGETDIAQVTATGSLRNEYYVTGSQTYCDLSECTNDGERGMLTSFSGCPTNCILRFGEVDGPIPLTFDGSRWRGTGTMKPEFGFNCDGTPDPPTGFTISVAVTSASVSHGIWTATAVTVNYGNSGGQGRCGPARLEWELAGPRGSG